MTAILLGTWPDGSPEWHAARQDRIGGSEVGTLMGWSPFETRAELRDRKLGLVEPKATTPTMARGHYLEQGVADWVADQTGAVYGPALSSGTFVHPDHDWALANPDKVLVGGRELLEIKTSSEQTPDHGWGRAGTDQIPLHYAAQVTWYLGILGATTCHVAVLFGKPFGFRKYRVRFDRSAFNYLLEQASIFRAELDAARQKETAAA